MSAVWACGRYWENGDNPQLVEQLHQRIADKHGMFPELGSVRYAATLASVGSPIQRAVSH